MYPWFTRARKLPPAEASVTATPLVSWASLASACIASSIAARLMRSGPKTSTSNSDSSTSLGMYSCFTWR
jgi:hypothetical protein